VAVASKLYEKLSQQMVALKSKTKIELRSYDSMKYKLYNLSTEVKQEPRNEAQFDSQIPFNSQDAKFTSFTRFMSPKSLDQSRRLMVLFQLLSLTRRSAQTPPQRWGPPR
jgi:hypothetical protein